MANYACVAIGINRYQFLQPLNYGQADARALRQFLVEQANLPSEHCLLLTDTSPLIEYRSTYPNRENIWRWLEADPQKSPQNSLNGVSKQWRWFFFSGYGANWEDVDYLMPIDGNPRDIPGTGIPVRSLLTALKAQGGDNILVMLDINRSPGLQAGKPAGIQTLELAKQMGIALVLSAQLDQFSHEAPALGNGLFSAALLEALRYYHTDITLGDLDEYLRERLPELCEHHWRPLQTPLMVIPAAHAKQQPIWPSALNSLTPQENSAIFSGAEISGRVIGLESFYGDESPNGTKPPVSKNTISPPKQQSNTSSVPTPAPNSNHKASSPGAMIPYPQEQFYEEDTNKRLWWQQVILWGTGAALVLALLLAAMTLRNRNAFITQQAVNPTTEEKSGRGQGEPGEPQGEPQGEPGSPSTETSAKASPLSPPSPSSLSSPFPSPSSPISHPSPLNRLQANQITLAQAKRSIQPNQASLFSQAIAQARKIQPGEPLYQQAQQDISRWSQVMLDLGEGRAKVGNLAGAIAAAKMIPKDDPAVYAKAQQAINQWQTLASQQQQNQATIQAAKQKLQRHQASSYNRAIATLRRVPPGQPGSAEAQQLIAQWSRQIYLIANSRASRGQFPAAISAAKLVPAGTPSYDAAQKAIARWQKGQN